jgi:hypothetical protein
VGLHYPQGFLSHVIPPKGDEKEVVPAGGIPLSLPTGGGLRSGLSISKCLFLFILTIFPNIFLSPQDSPLWKTLP